MKQEDLLSKDLPGQLSYIEPFLDLLKDLLPSFASTLEENGTFGSLPGKSNLSLWAVIPSNTLNKSTTHCFLKVMRLS